MNDKFWYLKNCNLFERLTPDQVSRLETSSQSKQFKRGNLLYMPSDQSDSVLLLVSGRVKIYYVTDDGKQALLAIIDPGEMFGELAIFGSGQRNEFAEAMDSCTVVMIPGSEIQRLMEEHSDVSIGVTKLMGLTRRRFERRLKSLLFRSNRERLIHLLIELAEKYGRATDKGLMIDIKLSQQDLANIIGSTRETVTLVLNELKAENSISVQRRQIVLDKADRLAAEIGVDAPEPKTENAWTPGFAANSLANNA